MNEKFLKLLKNLDVNRYQAQIYLAVLELGVATVLDIWKKTKIVRSQIYQDASVLVEKGMLEVVSKRNKKYIAVDPITFQKRVVEKEKDLQELKEILPVLSEISSKTRKNKNDFQVKMYEGEREIKKVLEEMIHKTKNQEMCTIIGDPNALHETVGEKYLDDWNKRFFRNGGSARSIVDSKYENFLTKKEELRKIKIYIKGIVNFKITTNIDIWENHVFMLKNEGKPSAILIESVEVYRSYKQIFEELWSKAL